LINGAIEAKEKDCDGKDHLDDRHWKFEGNPAPNEETAIVEGIHCTKE